jgi:beta-lactamase superfamily II metal-dependent hydrolase
MPIIKLAFLDVGQGDTIVISCPETQEAIVVDCVKSTPVIDYLRREDIKQLRGIIITHLHMDHYQQVANLLYNCPEVVGTQGCEILATSEDIVNPKDLRRESVRGTGSSALLTGDLEPAGWQHLKSKHPDLKSDVLKFPHHGGNWEEEETRDLVDTIKPSIIVISVGTDNGYDHPNSSTFAALYRRRNIHLLCTEATDKCQPCVLNQRAAVIEKFKSQAARTNAFLITPKKNQKQSLCAGTVIIELHDQPRVIQPEVTFHEAIIDEHYKEHQCYISIATPSSVI